MTKRVQKLCLEIQKSLQVCRTLFVIFFMDEPIGLFSPVQGESEGIEKPVCKNGPPLSLNHVQSVSVRPAAWNSSD